MAEEWATEKIKTGNMTKVEAWDLALVMFRACRLKSQFEMASAFVDEYLGGMEMFRMSWPVFVGDPPGWGHPMPAMFDRKMKPPLPWGPIGCKHKIRAVTVVERKGCYTDRRGTHGEHMYTTKKYIQRGPFDEYEDPETGGIWINLDIEDEDGTTHVSVDSGPMRTLRQCSVATCYNYYPMHEMFAYGTTFCGCHYRCRTCRDGVEVGNPDDQCYHECQSDQ